MARRVPHAMADAAPDLVAAIEAALGPAGLLREPEAMAPHLADWRGVYRGRALAVVRPATTDQVATVVRLCAEAQVPVVPQGGNTGLVGGGVPRESGGEILLALGRMNAIRALDLANDTITVEAGCILAHIHAAAAAADRLFPLSLGAEGSCQIGGNLSTNAGGLAVLRYGTTRDLVLGLEVVLPDGRVWNGLRGLRKDNTGYDLKQLFIGAEGTLGVITAAVLKLFPRPRERATAFVAIPGPEAAIALLARCRQASGDAVTGFELMPRLGLELARRHVPAAVNPLADPPSGPPAHYLLIELSSPAADRALGSALERVLAEALEQGLALDAVLAASEAQAAALWRLREAIVEGQRLDGLHVKHDVAVPLSQIPAFLGEATAAVTAALPGIRIVAFGHAGDGNIHFNLLRPEGTASEPFLEQGPALSRIVHDVVLRFGGSISAEHGIGRLRRDDLPRYKPPVELELMRRIKAALDPDGLMNPGKLL